MGSAGKEMGNKVTPEAGSWAVTRQEAALAPLSEQFASAVYTCWRRGEGWQGGFGVPRPRPLTAAHGEGAGRTHTPERFSCQGSARGRAVRWSALSGKACGSGGGCRAEQVPQGHSLSFKTRRRELSQVSGRCLTRLRSILSGCPGDRGVSASGGEVVTQT